MITLENTGKRPYKFNAHGETVVFGIKGKKVVLVKEVKLRRAEDKPLDTATRFSANTQGVRRPTMEASHEKFIEIYDPKNPEHKDLRQYGHIVELGDEVAKAVLERHKISHQGDIKAVSLMDGAVEARALELAREMVAKGAVPEAKPVVEDPMLSKMAAAAAETKAREKASKGG